jgi:hypothetical protein
MEYLFTIFAIVWIVFNIPFPPAGGTGTTKLLIGVFGIVLLVLVLIGMIPRHG